MFRYRYVRRGTGRSSKIQIWGCFLLSPIFIWLPGPTSGFEGTTLHTPGSFAGTQPTYNSGTATHTQRKQLQTTMKLFQRFRDGLCPNKAMTTTTRTDWVKAARLLGPPWKALMQIETIRRPWGSFWAAISTCKSGGHGSRGYSMVRIAHDRATCYLLVCTLPG